MPRAALPEGGRRCGVNRPRLVERQLRSGRARLAKRRLGSAPDWRSGSSDRRASTGRAGTRVNISPSKRSGRKCAQARATVVWDAVGPRMAEARSKY